MAMACFPSAGLDGMDSERLAKAVMGVDKAADGGDKTVVRVVDHNGELILLGPGETL